MKELESEKLVVSVSFHDSSADSLLSLFSLPENYALVGVLTRSYYVVEPEVTPMPFPLYCVPPVISGKSAVYKLPSALISPASLFLVSLFPYRFPAREWRRPDGSDELLLRIYRKRFSCNVMGVSVTGFPGAEQEISLPSGGSLPDVDVQVSGGVILSAVSVSPHDAYMEKPPIWRGSSSMWDIIIREAAFNIRGIRRKLNLAGKPPAEVVEAMERALEKRLSVEDIQKIYRSVEEKKPRSNIIPFMPEN